MADIVHLYWLTILSQKFSIPNKLGMAGYLPGYQHNYVIRIYIARIYIIPRTCGNEFVREFKSERKCVLLHILIIVKLCNGRIPLINFMVALTGCKKI